MRRARILLADDHQEFLAVEVRLLEPEFDIVKMTRSGRAAIEGASECGPDAVILDISMPGMTGIEAALRLRESGSPAKIVFLTVHDDPDYIRAGLAAGASAYVLKSRLASDLIVALRAALAGRSFVSPSADWKC